MTRTRVAPERNRRIVEAPREPASDEASSGQDSPAPPMVSSPPVDRAKAASYRSRGSVMRAVGRIVATGLILGGTSTGAVLGTYHFAQTSPRFAVRQIEVDGLRRKNREAILELSQVGIGKNIFSVDTVAVEKKVLQDPWIREVRVERRLPGTIRIAVVEREVGAMAMLDEQLLLVTRTAEPFKKYEPSDPADLPVITGVAVDGAGRDPALERRRIATALEVLRHYERTSLARVYAPQEVHLTPGGEAILSVGKSGIALHLGLGPWAKKLAMAERILQKLRGQKGNVSMVFLDNRAHPERAVVRMR